jgi:hypothetical protein
MNDINQKINEDPNNQRKMDFYNKVFKPEANNEQNKTKKAEQQKKEEIIVDKS